MGRLREGATMTTVGRTIKVAVVQMLVGVNKAENVSKAVRLIKEAASHDSQLVVLPVNNIRGGKGF